MPGSVPPPHEELQKEISFRQELSQLLNRYSRENTSGTPDYILANHLGRCLDSFDQTMIERENWYGRSIKPSPSIEDPNGNPNDPNRNY